MKEAPTSRRLHLCQLLMADIAVFEHDTEALLLVIRASLDGVKKTHFTIKQMSDARHTKLLHSGRRIPPQIQ